MSRRTFVVTKAGNPLGFSLQQVYTSRHQKLFLENNNLKQDDNPLLGLATEFQLDFGRDFVPFLLLQHCLSLQIFVFGCV